MPSIIATEKTMFHQPREDKLAKREEWTLSDGRTVRIETYKDGGTNTMAWVRPKRDDGVAYDGPWHHITVANARRIIKTATDLPQLP